MDAEPVESISAITLIVQDMRASVDFYAALGFALLYGGADQAFTSLRAGTGYVNLQLATDALATPAWGRAIFWVRDVDEMYDRAVASGFTPLMAPADASWGGRYFHIHDPDGHELSFARPLAR